jgi:(E)-4-hydroxy-3-methylbut-2-enyl-diphosphate synthase
VDIIRRKSKEINIGGRLIGGDNPILIQSMTNTKTSNIEDTVNQIISLEKAGCEIIRVAIPNMESAKAIKDIKRNINIPLVGDIHFDYNLAIEAIKNGVDKIRINPGNIGSPQRVKAIVDEALKKNIPLRVGVNGGSLERDLVKKYGGVTADGLAESALNQVKLLEKYNFKNIVVAIKSSDIKTTIESYRKLADIIDYPFHIGITEAGTKFSGTVKSSIGIGNLLLNGYGDTLRVSLTGNPEEEVFVGKEILNALQIRNFGINVISCPTCGRTNIDIEKIALAVSRKYSDVNAKITVAVMGCAVNGPGEAKEADLGVAGGIGEGLIFKKGEIVRRVKEEDIVAELSKEIDEMIR